MTIRAAFSIGVDLAGLDRLMVIHKISIIMPLPASYQRQLQTVPGVEIVTHNSWFGGIYSGDQKQAKDDGRLPMEDHTTADYRRAGCSDGAVRGEPWPVSFPDVTYFAGSITNFGRP